MTQMEIFWYGAAGSVVTFLIVFVLPELILLWQGKRVLQWNWVRAAAGVMLTLLFLAIGGFLTMALSDAVTIKEAVFYGLGMQTITGGTAKGLLRP